HADGAVPGEVLQLQPARVPGSAGRGLAFLEAALRLPRGELAHLVPGAAREALLAAQPDGERRQRERLRGHVRLRQLAVAELAPQRRGAPAAAAAGRLAWGQRLPVLLSDGHHAGIQRTER